MSDADSYHSIEDEERYHSPLLGSRLSSVNDYHSNGTVSSVQCPSVVILEPPNSYRSRWRSIRIMYLTMFMGSVTFTITVSSLWPFLQELDPSVTPSFLGWVVAVYSLGQLVASPFFGGWANVRKSSREPLTVSLLLTVLFNVLYMYLQSIPSKPQIYMILARGLVGFSAGNVAVVRSYISAATTLKERTACMANVSIFQAVGFVLGPVIQTCLVPLHFPGPVESRSLHINMYTAPAMFASILALTNLLLVIFVFKEHKVDGLEEAGIASHIQQAGDEDSEAQNGGSNGHAHGINGEDTSPLLDSTEGSKPDMVAVLSTIFLFFVILFMFTVFETIGTPLTMHMYAWTRTEATLYQGIILGCSATTSIVVFVIVKVLAKKINERYLLLAGLIICLGAFVFFIPWGPSMPPLAYIPLKNISLSTNSSHLGRFDELAGEGESRLANLLTFKTQNSGHGPHKFLSYKGVGPHIFEQETSNFFTENKDKFSLRQRNKRDGKTILAKGWIPKKILRRENQLYHSYSRSRTGPELLGVGANGQEKQQISKDLGLFSKLSPTFHHFHTKLSTYSNPFSLKPSATTVPLDSTISKSSSSSSSKATTKTTTTPTSATTKSTTTATKSTTTKSTTTAKTTSTTTTTTTAASTTSTTPAHDNETVAPEGCPWQYTWCRHVPALPLLQYLAATLVFSVGYPMCQMLSYTIYSKILGSMPQGVWMGWITAAGCLARTVGPIYVSQVYDMSGPQATFGSVAGFILLTTIFYMVVFRRLVPCKERRGQENGSAGYGTQ